MSFILSKPRLEGMPLASRSELKLRTVPRGIDNLDLIQTSTCTFVVDPSLTHEYRGMGEFSGELYLITLVYAQKCMF